MKNVNRIACTTRAAGGGEGGSAVPLELCFPKNNQHFVTTNT